MNKNKKNSGFTLMELLSFLAVVGLFIMLLLPKPRNIESSKDFEKIKSIKDVVNYTDNHCLNIKKDCPDLDAYCKSYIENQENRCKQLKKEYSEYIEKNVITNKKINNILKNGLDNNIKCSSKSTIANDSNNPYCLAITMELKNMNMEYINYSDVVDVYLNQKEQDKLTVQAKNIIESIN